ncbi:hypothetical protein AAVH_25247, partial [Aphelenchoides avenae]
KQLILHDVRSTPEIFRSLFDVPFVNVAQLKLHCCELLASHIDDALLVSLAKANVKRVNFSAAGRPVDATAYDVSEDAILDFLFRDFNGVGAGDRELVLSKITVTQNFFNRLVEHNLTSRTTGRMTLKIDRCAAQDTTLYAGHRTSTNTTDRYEFEGVVRFQLVIFRRALEMRRGTDPGDGSPFFV